MVLSRVRSNDYFNLQVVTLTQQYGVLTQHVIISGLPLLYFVFQCVSCIILRLVFRIIRSLDDIFSVRTAFSSFWALRLV